MCYRTISLFGKIIWFGNCISPFFLGPNKKMMFLFKVHYLYHISLTRVSHKTTPDIYQKTWPYHWPRAMGISPLVRCHLGVGRLHPKALGYSAGLGVSVWGKRNEPLKKGRPSKDVWPYDAYMVICWLYIYTHVYMPIFVILNAISCPYGCMPQN